MEVPIRLQVVGPVRDASVESGVLVEAVQPEELAGAEALLQVPS